MNSTDFVYLVPWVIAHGYLIFFIAALIEGPFVTAAAGVAAALGYYNIFLIILLAIAGDIGGDFLYYGLGYIFNKPIKAGRLGFLGINKERVEKIKDLLHKRVGRTVIFIKLTPFIGPPGLMILGAVRVPFKKLLKTALSIAVPKCILFALLGYYSAEAYVYLDKTIAKGQNALVIVAISFIVVYLIYKKITAEMAKRYE
jgi:membrane protein DedA with SNARE-associated domain